MSLNIPASFVVVLVPRGNPSSASAGHSMAYISRAAKGMNDGDAVLRKALAWSIINVMRAQHRRGKVVDAGKRRGVRVWNLQSDLTNFAGLR